MGNLYVDIQTILAHRWTPLSASLIWSSAKWKLGERERAETIKKSRLLA